MPAYPDAEAGGPVWRLLAAYVAPGRGDAVALRLMAAVHRLVLTGRAPSLAVHYPSAGGRPCAAVSDAFLAVVEEQAGTLAPLVSQPCQTNEVGRAAALIFGLLELAAASGLPLRLLEVGASAGLNLRLDHFRYSGGGMAWGDPASPVDLAGFWAEAPPHGDVALRVIERSGCDLSPLDPASEAGRLALRSSVWADQLERYARLEGALSLAARVPATVEAASAAGWAEARLAAARPGAVTVVYHSVVEEYLPQQERLRFRACIEDAGARAATDAPLAWLRVEPATSQREHGVTLTTWPGGEERCLAICGPHGADVRRTRTASRSPRP